jgi:hypothetical protein
MVSRIRIGAWLGDDEDDDYDAEDKEDDNEYGEQYNTHIQLYIRYS